VAPQTVQQWLATHLSGSVRELIDELMPDGNSPDADELLDDLVAYVQQRRVVRLTELAQELGRSVEEIESCVQGHADQFGTLQGPPVVIFDLAVAGE